MLLLFLNMAESFSLKGGMKEGGIHGYTNPSQTWEGGQKIASYGQTGADPIQPAA